MASIFRKGLVTGERRYGGGGAHLRGDAWRISDDEPAASPPPLVAELER